MPSYDFLARLTPETREELRRRANRKRIPKRSFVFHEGDPATSVFLIEKGLVKVTKSIASGRSVLLALRGPGAIIGELATLSDAPRSASIVTVEDSDVLVLSHRDFLELSQAYRDVGEAVLHLLVDRVRELSMRLVEFSSADALSRVCGRIMELVDDAILADVHAAAVTGRHHEPIRISLPYSQEELAESAGLSREAVVKSLRQLRDLGWIETRRKAVVLLDLPSVQARSGADAYAS